MANPIETFFEQWSETDAEKQKKALSAILRDDTIYSDARSGERLKGPDAIANYVAMFAANAPGWTAMVGKLDDVHGYYRAVVTFGGKGPDGSDMSQQGTYFGEEDGAGKLLYLAGFVG